MIIRGISVRKEEKISEINKTDAKKVNIGITKTSDLDRLS